jgi:N-acetylmuramoyl-L-alanine amidase
MSDTYKLRAIFIFILTILAFQLSYLQRSWAAACKTGECQYYQAEKSYKALKNDKKSQKRRDKWLSVVEQYKKVSELEPKGSFAAVGLYRTGIVYQELYGFSKNKNDLAMARTYFEKASEFKKSKVRFEAEQLLKALPDSGKEKKNDDRSDSLKKENDNKDPKETADSGKKSKSKKGKDDSTKKVNDPKTDKKDQNETNDRKSKKDNKRTGKNAGSDADSDKNISKKNNDVNKEDGLKDKKEDGKDTGTESKDRKKKKKQDTEKAEKDNGIVKPDPTFLQNDAKKQDDSKKGTSVDKKTVGLSQIKRLRFGSLPTRTRIVIDTDGAVSYKHGLLEKSGKDGGLRTLFLDIRKSQLQDGANSTLAIDDERVKDMKATPGEDDSVRISVGIKTFKDYKVFSLRNPARVVIDVWGHTSTATAEEVHEQDEDDNGKTSPVLDVNDIAKQLQLGVKRVVIDPGHGGQDCGAIGYDKSIHEKDVALSIGKKLAERLEKEMNLDVIMTRSDDTFITLEERTQIANRKKADLFVSIHTNASLNKNANGIETYFLNLARDKDSVAVAARENATSEKNISDLQSILDSLMRNTKITESSKLATYVQDSLVRNMGKTYDHISNKGVKQAPFYVLLGARMPAILVETSFISNERECGRLIDTAYQDRLCDSIIDGIKAYIKKTSPMKDTKRK